MKRISSFAAYIFLIGSGATAADLPTGKNTALISVPSPTPLFTGFYVGLNAGYSWSDAGRVDAVSQPMFANASLFGSSPSLALSSRAGNSSIAMGNGGFIGGGQVGYNYALDSNILVGGEADIQGLSPAGFDGVDFRTAGDGTRTYNSLAHSSRNIDYLGTLRARAGFLVAPDLLIYGTGGFAYGGVGLTSGAFQTRTPIGFTRVPFSTGARISDTRTGWTAGGGLEWMFWPNWSAKTEYLFYDLGRVGTSAVLSQANAVGVPFISSAISSTTHFKGHIVRAGINYHFDLIPPPF